MTAYTLQPNSETLENLIECPRCLGNGFFEAYAHIWDGRCYLCCGNKTVTAAKAQEWKEEQGIKQDTDKSAYTMSLYIGDNGKPSKIVLTENVKLEDGTTWERQAESWVWTECTISYRDGSTDSHYAWVSGGGMLYECDADELRALWAQYKAEGATMRKQVRTKNLKRWAKA